MNHTRHPTTAFPPLLPPATGRRDGGRLPFLHDAGHAGHDLLVLSARPDLAPDAVDPVDAFIQRYLPRELR